MDKTLIDLARTKARGLDRNQLTLTKEDQTHLRKLKHRSIPRYNILKPSKESHTPSRPRGLHPVGALARTHRKATTLQPQFITRASLYESGHTRAKAWGLLLGT
jgi:hypothetical protein